MSYLGMITTSLKDPHLTSTFQANVVVVLSQGVCVIPWKVLGPGDDKSESINTLKVYCP